MSGISIGRSHPRPCSGRKTLRRCRNNEEAHNVILIDADSENFDNVIIIDVPESLPKNSRGPRKDKKRSPRNVIYIDDDDDDDDDDDETPSSNHFVGVNNVSCTAGASSSRKSRPAAKHSVDAVDEECEFVHVNVTPVRLSKCKRTYSGKASARNCYGLDTDSETDSSDNECPDCEIVEDSSGEVQQQWEKAFSRRRKDTNNGHSGIRDHHSTTQVIREDSRHTVEEKDETRKHKETSSCSSTEKFNNENDDPSPFGTKDYSHSGFVSMFDDHTVDDFSLQSVLERHLNYNKSDAHSRSDPQTKGTPSIYSEKEDNLNCEPGNSNSHTEERGRRSASSKSAFRGEPTKEFDHPTPVFRDEEIPIVQPCPKEPEACVDRNSSYGKSNPVEDEATISKVCQDSFQTEVDPGRCSPKNAHKNIHEMANDCVKEREHVEHKLPHPAGNSKEMENVMPERSSFQRSTVPDKQAIHNSTASCATAASVSEKSLFSKNSLGSGDDTQKAYYHENRQPVPEIPLSENGHLNEAKLRQDNSVSNSQWEEDKDDQPHSENGDTSPTLKSCLINEREKLKETDEYKRAVEEEWASRQQEILIQAEEAQRLRQLLKRRKAESMRLLDMERRQKQRVEEMRNTQKKDEENMNLKEAIRAEVRKELKKLEITCRSMASLLHLLGVRVGGWPSPLPQEVQAAYKRALLAFHPDRASRSDIRQQVESEEKFKLINRLKEKFPPSL
ncbi:hypothetical protein BUALT_Bualt05G0139300 [Buddleja alternifolia]|uniref:J domain-containing protein n=1 Tax=Buddleja alternifolia TaxID=168488 RepID=A0AAV6XJ67_9LAMI|nr:hypothetical protein BUALT_Bualt05G0139300 [Buddleja alternifolia]